MQGTMKKNGYLSDLLLFVMLFFLATASLYGQNCAQNNLNIQSIEFRDSEGNPFDPQNVKHKEGDIVGGQIFVTFGGSSTNAYNLRFLYDVFIDGVSSGDRINLCLFINQNVQKETPQFITDFSLRWGAVVEFKNIFMRWFTNSGNDDCPTEEGSNAQCYSDPNGMVVNTPFVALPVIWHNISVVKAHNRKEVIVEWSTLKEWESSHFEIERSINNADRFVVIDSVAASYYSSEIKKYQYIDSRIPAYSTRVYYRLKQIDMNGVSEYSKVLMLNMDIQAEKKSTWLFYPNPVLGDNLNISLRNPKAYNGEQIHVKIISNLGVSYQLLQDCLDPCEINIGAMTKNLPRGILLVELSWGDQIEIFKLIKH